MEKLLIFDSAEGSAVWEIIKVYYPNVFDGIV